MKTKIIPLRDRILVKPTKEKLKGDIIRAESVEAKRPSRGIVLTLGKEYKGEIRKGDEVFFQKYEVEELIIDKEQYCLASPEVIFAIIRNVER